MSKTVKQNHRIIMKYNLIVNFQGELRSSSKETSRFDHTVPMLIKVDQITLNVTIIVIIILGILYQVIIQTKR